MANHVNSHVTFERINEDASKKLYQMFENLRHTNSHDYKWFADIFVDENTTYEDTEKFEWTTKHLGSKWCYLTDWDVTETRPHFTLDSAWCAPEEAIMKLINILKEYDENIIATMVYDDEMPNFVGWTVYSSEGMEDGSDLDGNELHDALFAEYPELKKGWDEEEEWWFDNELGEKCQEEFEDNKYDYISTWQQDQIDNCLDWLVNNVEGETL
jgi:hypothetical protein